MFGIQRQELLTDICPIKKLTQFLGHRQLRIQTRQITLGREEKSVVSKILSKNK